MVDRCFPCTFLKNNQQNASGIDSAKGIDWINCVFTVHVEMKQPHAMAEPLKSSATNAPAAQPRGMAFPSTRFPSHFPLRRNRNILGLHYRLRLFGFTTGITCHQGVWQPSSRAASAPPTRTLPGNATRSSASADAGHAGGLCGQCPPAVSPKKPLELYCIPRPSRAITPPMNTLQLCRNSFLLLPHRRHLGSGLRQPRA